MPYRAVLSLDVEKANWLEFQRLIAALMQADWTYVRRGALVIETDDMAKVWLGMDLVARQQPSIGEIQSLTLQIQSSEDFANGIPYKAAKERPNALKEVLAKPRNPP